MTNESAAKIKQLEDELADLDASMALVGRELSDLRLKTLHKETTYVGSKLSAERKKEELLQVKRRAGCPLWIT